MKNVIILGAGRTGSSILAGLIAADNFYINKEKIQSRPRYPNGDYENPDLIKLNKQIFNQIGYHYKKYEPYQKISFSKLKMTSLENIEGAIGFIEKCNKNRPWLWKDPRLCFTIYCWIKLLNKDNINFIFIKRDPNLVFKSHSKKFIKYTKKEVFKSYEDQERAALMFLNQMKIPHLEINYEELENETVIYKLNKFLKTKITLEQYRDVYKPDQTKKENILWFYIRYSLGVFKLFLTNRN